MLIGNYLKYLFAIPHDLDFRFFWNFRKYRGTLALIGDDRGRTLTTFRIYNQSFRIVLFDKQPSVERRIRAHRAIAGGNFEFHNVNIGTEQENTPRSERIEVLFKEDLLIKTKPNLKEARHSLEPRALDSFKRHWDAIRISRGAFRPQMLHGMAATLERWKTLLMLPNFTPEIAEAANFLTRCYYRPYLYHSRSNSLQPVTVPVRGRNLFFIHRAIIDPENSRRVKVAELRDELKLSRL